MRLVLLVLAVLSAPVALTQELDFDVAINAANPERARKIVPVALSMPVSELLFVEQGNQLEARYSIATIVGEQTKVVVKSERVTAPRGTNPFGAVTAGFTVVMPPNVREIAVRVTDENAGIDSTRMLTIGAPVDTTGIDAQWHEALARAASEKKPLLVFFSATPCGSCRRFERITVPHPTSQRRLAGVVFLSLPGGAGEAAKLWASADSGVALFDRSGALRARWTFIPDTANFNTLLESVVAVAPHFERAVQLAEAGNAGAADLEAASAYARMSRFTEARAALAGALERGDEETRQKAQALLEGKNDRPAPAAPAIEPKHIRILPFPTQLVSGRQLVRTHVASAAIARVAFALDGRHVRRVDRPPFSTTLDFGALPERHSIRVLAFDRSGRELARDERVVNETGETFWIRLQSPREGAVSGSVRVETNVRVPSSRRVQRVVLSWNEAARAVITNAPWEAVINVPGRTGVLRAVAELDDGRTSEDAVLLNAAGVVSRANVQLVEMPMTVLARDGVLPEITPETITVREGAKTRRVESIAGANETPLTIGLLIDASESMRSTLPDVQEAAIRFLETILGERDRAFLITFDTRARLVQQATPDVAMLRSRIMKIHADGLTALHDAVILGLLQFEGVKGRRALIVFSDGSDRTSQYSAADVRELARRIQCRFI